MHDGHPAFCITCTAEKSMPSTRMFWGRTLALEDCEKYKGHTVRVTVWTKTENVSGVMRPAFHPRNNTGKQIGQEKDDPAIRGTTDWTQRVFTCRIPKETDFINDGFNFVGTGKFWYDRDSVKYEIVK
jgi:hypothetical protein